MNHLSFSRLALVLLAGILVTGCGKTPERVVENFYTNLEKGELTEAKQSLSKQILGYLGEQKLNEALSGETERITKCGGIKSIASQLTTKGEMSSGTTTVEYKGECKPRTEQTKLVKEDGSWKITANK